MSTKSKSKNMNKSKLPDSVSQVRIAGEGRDEWKGRYFKFKIEESDSNIPPMSTTQLISDPKPLFAALSNAGCNLFTAKSRDQLLNKLQARKPKPSSFTVATRLGWNSGAYVLPSEIIGEPAQPLEVLLAGLDRAMLAKYRRKGTLKDWQDNVAALCAGNSRLMFAVSLAFTGPILRFVQGPKAGGFQVFGDAETGKTTSAMVAGSVWGCHHAEGRREKGFAESWNTTAGKVELTALAHNDGVLILDETKRAGKNDKERIQVVIEVTFKLAEQSEKERLTNQGPTRAWRCYFLSTSNYSLKQLARLGDRVIDAAEIGRLADIPLPAKGSGIYEKLHGCADGEELSDNLQRRSRSYCGSAITAFLRKLVLERQDDAQGLRTFLASKRKAYRRKFNAALADDDAKPLNRHTGRYETCFAAGSLAIKYGILPWSRKELLRAILSCQLDGLRHVDDDPLASAVTALRATLAKYLADNRKAFVQLSKKRPRLGQDDIDAVPGYSEKRKGQRWFYLTSACLDKIIGRGATAGALKHLLAKDGLLDKTKDRFVVQRHIFKGGKGNQNHQWVHALKAKLAKESSHN